MKNADKPPCPNCGRPMGFEYQIVEAGKCQLWRVLKECPQIEVNPTTVRDCFTETTIRLAAIRDTVADLNAAKKAAQRALDRHHEAKRAAADPFPDNARIE